MSINTIVSKDIPVVEADVLLIDRVLQNLIDNAIHFCKEGDTINIELKSLVPGDVNITISDTGAGIAHEHMPHIFDSYLRKEERGWLGHQLPVCTTGSSYSQTYSLSIDLACLSNLIW